MKTSSYFQSNLFTIQDVVRKQSVTNSDTLLVKAILLSAIGTKTNDNKVIREAISLLEQYVKKEKNAFAVAYLAMNYALVARYDNNASIKTQYSQKAIRTFREAVEQDKKEWYIRFLRGNVLFEFPEFFGVMPTVKEDFFYLEDLVKKGELKDPSILVSVYYFLGEIYKLDKKISQALSYWQKCVEIADKEGMVNEDVEKAKKRIELFSD
jgi:tetratricopeptide (TPR) repeat protein